MLLSYAGIGNMSTPEEALIEIREVAGSLSSLGLKLRTGWSWGADDAFYQGHTDRRTKKVFLPHPTFRNAKPVTWVQQHPSNMAMLLTSLIHPHWHTMSSATRFLMARNLDILAEFKQLDEKPEKVKLCETHHWLTVETVSMVVCYEKSGASELASYRKGGTNFSLYALHVMEKARVIPRKPPAFNLCDVVSGFDAVEYAKTLVTLNSPSAVEIR
jgi:hypothetical protein